LTYSFKKKIVQLLYLIFHDQTVLENSSRMTICIENHFNLNKILLLIVGLWPYHRTKLTEFHHLFFTTILTSFVIVQVCLYFYTHIITYSIYYISILYQYISVYIFSFIIILIISFQFLDTILYITFIYWPYDKT